MGQLSFKASAKKSASSGSGDSFIPSDKKLEYSFLRTNFTTVLSSFIVNKNCASARENLSRISDLCSSSSSSAKMGNIILSWSGAIVLLPLIFR